MNIKVQNMKVSGDYNANPGMPEQAPAGARADALYRVLRNKGIASDGFIEQWHKTFVDEYNPNRGAELVARAWVDPAFRKKLLDDATAAIDEYGWLGPQGDFIKALEDTETVKHVVVCTLCSCTPWPILGLPTEWYKGFEYRARLVREPRKVLAELGTVLPENVQVKVYDTSAETRYIVIPMRPKNTEGWSEEQLRKIITKDCLLGVAVPKAD